MTSLAEFMGPMGLFREAFEPLREVLNRQALALYQDHRLPSPWVLHSGKGGRDPRSGRVYREYRDQSIYHHAMEVLTLSLIRFYHAWQRGRLPGIAPADRQAALAALRDQVLLAFTHDADKVLDEVSDSPTREQVARVFTMLEAATWSGLTVDQCYGAVSRVEAGRGSYRLLHEPRLPGLLFDQAGFVKWADTLTSIAARDGAGALVRRYNEDLPRYREELPDTRWVLRVFHESPIILYRLRARLLGTLYELGEFPPICRLNGEELSVTVPEDFDLNEPLDALLDEISLPLPEYHRDHTSNHITLRAIHSYQDLQDAVSNNLDGRLLAIQAGDWRRYPVIGEMIRGWSAAVSGVDMAPVVDTGKGMFFPLVAQEAEPEDSWQRAISLVVALRGDETRSQQLEARLQRWREARPSLVAGLGANLPGVDLAGLHLNSRITLTVLQLALDISGEPEPVVESLIETAIGSFRSAPPVDAGALELIAGLKQSQGLLEEPEEEAFLPYSAHPQGGTCLLTGTPTATVITSKQPLAGLKAVAFNNRIGHIKNIRSLGDNYLSPAALKAQDLLRQSMETLGARRGWPMTVAVPFQGMMHSGLHDEGLPSPPFRLTAYHKDADIEEIFPWNRDASTAFPLMIESMGNKIEEVVRTAYLMAKLAAFSGNPVHVFARVQRDIRAAFYFEPMPALLTPLLRDLMDFENRDATTPADEPHAFRRYQLPALLIRLDLLSRILGSNFGYGFDVVRSMGFFGWAAVAWMRERMLAEGAEADRVVRSRDIDTARSHFPMHQATETQLSRLAEAGAAIQRFSGFGAARNKRLKAFETAFTQYLTGLRYERPRAEIVAAMADSLVTQLDRNQLFAKGAGPFRTRCERFADLFMDLMENQPDHQPVDARFLRFARAGYSHLLQQTYADLKNPRESKSEVGRQMQAEAEQLGLALEDINDDDDDED